MSDHPAPPRTPSIMNRIVASSLAQPLLVILVTLLLPKGIPTMQQIVLVTVLMAAINQPHFAHSYQMFYRNFRAKAFGGSYPRALRYKHPRP